MKAVITEKRGGPVAVINDRPEPRLRTNGYVLVRVKAFALNPADVAYVDYGLTEADCLLGCDFAGVVEKVGPGVHRNFKEGDRVCGPVRCGDPLEIENGSFAELICVKADMLLHIPDGMSFEDGSTLGVTTVTTGRCLYQKFGLPLPDKPDANPGHIFIYGGSSAMGTMVIQFAKMSNYKVVTTCSPRNFDLCKAYGADYVFDYHDPESIEQINALTNNSLKLCVDCISTESAAAFCGKVLSPGGKYSGIMMAKCPRDDVESLLTLGYSFLGEDWEQFGVINPASMEDFEFSKNFAELCEGLLAKGQIKCHPVDLRPGGLDAIPAAMEDLRAKKVSGAKIVLKA